MDQPDQNECPACAYPCAGFRIQAAPPSRAPATPHREEPAWPRRLLAATTVAAGLMVGLNALVQAANVVAAWLRHSG